MKVLGIIPARQGSKSIASKNTVALAGKPLITYTLEAAKASRLDGIVVTTDCAIVKSLANDHGLEVIDRPEHLAQDDTPMMPVLQHALSMAGEAYDAVCLLQPTCPLRRAEDIDAAIEEMQANRATSVISYAEVGANHPARMVTLLAGLPVPVLADRSRWANKQDLPPVYLRSGDIYLTRTECIACGDLVGSKPRAYIVPRDRHLNIDCQRDLEWAEFVLGKRPMHKIVYTKLPSFAVD